MWLMKTLLTSGCTNQRGAGQNRECTNPTFSKLSHPSGFYLSRRFLDVWIWLLDI
ncbi:hypothetical protein GYM26_004946 [Escherichia coli]|nr:hypothetical protein [Salmonella enterica subsp. enterica]EFI3648282.1 hypothetical protein [Escherichia coli]EFI4058041.1 hypothetical protein [Escherichia coli]